VARRVLKSTAQVVSMTSNPRVPDAAIGAHHVRTGLVGLLAAGWSLASPAAASASLLSPAAEDKMATFIALFVIFVVPVVLIVLFWIVHIIPERIAHQNHHPQFEAIRTLCLLSLVFGGLLWPLAWLWAYTKPVGYKLAYGTDKHPDYFKEHGLPEPQSATADIRQRVTALEGRGVPADELDAIRSDLAAIESRLGQSDARSEVS
jgi:CBS domain containing-hemolysin-like protein